MNRKLLHISDGVKIIFTAILLAVPLYPKFPFIRVPGSAVSIRLEDFLLLSAALLIFIYYLPRIKKFFKENVHQAILIYLIIGLLSLLSSLLILKTVDPLLGLLHWIRRVEYFVPFFLGFIFLSSHKNSVEYTVKLLLLVVTIVFVYGIGQRYYNWPMIVTQNTEYAKGVALRWTTGSHLNSTFAGHYDLATFLVFILPTIILSFYLIKNKVSKIILFIIFIFGLWLLVNTASRISLVSYLISAVFGLFLIKKFSAIPVIFILSAAFIIFSTNLQDRYTHLFDVVREKINPMITTVMNSEVYAKDMGLQIGNELPTPTPTPIPVVEDRSTSIRLNIEWPRAVQALAKNPLLGTGYSSISLATDNDYLRALGETGVLGFFAFLLIFVRVIEKIFDRLPFVKKYEGIQLAYVAGVTGAFPGVMINAIFIDIFEASKFAIIYWLLMGVLVGLLYANIKKNNQSS